MTNLILGKAKRGELWEFHSPSEHTIWLIYDHKSGKCIEKFSNGWVCKGEEYYSLSDGLYWTKIDQERINELKSELL